MKYVCNNCGAEFVLTNDLKKCPSCGDEIDFSKINESKEKQKEDYGKIVDDYKRTNNSNKLIRTIQNYKDIPERETPGFDNVWRNFILNAVGASEELKDKDLQTFLKNHAREYDAEYGSDLFLSVLQAYPKVASTSDWDEVISSTYKNISKFSGLCEHLIENIIIKNKSRQFAIEIFYMIKAKEADGIEAGKTYLRALFEKEEVANEVFTVQAFNRGKSRKFIKDAVAYRDKYLKKEGTVLIEETEVWNNYRASVGKQKKRNIIIGISTFIVVAAALLITFLFLNSVNKETVNFTIDKVIEAYYGDDLDLSGYKVTYKKNNGEEVTEVITTKMLKNYNPELVGQKQTVTVEFSGVEYQITIVVSEKKLAKPKLTQNGNYVTWEMVLNAENYNVYVNSATTPTEVTKSLSYDLSKNPNYGDLEITVRANASASGNFKNSEMSEKLIVKKLEIPQNVKYENGTLKWDAVNGATKYEISVNGTPFNSTTNSLEIEFTDEYTDVSITAVGDETTVVGTATEKIYHYILDNISAMKYENNVISWEADPKANSFKVYVDGAYWKDFGRKYFNIQTDGFLDSFTNAPHKIEVVATSSTVGIVDSSKFGYDVQIGDHITLNENMLTWSSVGLGATYYVTFNDQNKELGAPYISLDELTINEGENLISVYAIYDGKTIVCETATLYKNAKPTINYANGNWVLETDASISYKYDNGEWAASLIAVSDILDGAHTVKAIRNKGTSRPLEINSDEVSLTIYRLAAPVISANYGQIDATYDKTKYRLDLYFAEETSENYALMNSFDDIIQEGNYNIKAKLVGKTENSEYDIFLDSNFSNTVLVKKLAAPDVTKDDATNKVTSSATNVKFYYLNNDVETELAGGLISNLPAGVFEIYARRIAAAVNELDSAPTPTNQRVTVFNLNITLEVNKHQTSQSQFYLYFNNCDELDSLSFDYTFEYYDGSNNKIGTKSQNGISVTKTQAMGNRIVYLANYRTDVIFEPGYTQQNIYKVEITIKIKSGSSVQTLTATFIVS